MASNSQRFIECFNQLEIFMKRYLDTSGPSATHMSLLHKMRAQNKLFDYYYDDLAEYCDLRNAIVHNSTKNYDPIAEPHDVVVESYEELLDKVIKPQLVSDIYVPIQKMYTASLSDNVHVVIKCMLENTFTHVPILQDGTLIGVFSENTLFSYFGDNHEIIQDFSLVNVEYFKDYLPIQKHQSETFEFISRDTTSFDIEKLFKEMLKKNIRLGAVYVTHSGKPTEKILGMITAWDLPNLSY